MKAFILFCLFILASASEFDYIVIGGGGSGSLFANRLSANHKNRVLVLERGVEECEECDSSAATPVHLQLQGPWDPNYFTTQQLIGRSMYRVGFSGAGTYVASLS